MDTIVGLTGADTIDGFEGADRLEGDRDPDRLTGGAGDDTIRGGFGDDTLSGEVADGPPSPGPPPVQPLPPGLNQLFGGDGNDQLAGGSGDDTVRGGRGDDSLIGDTRAGPLPDLGSNPQAVLPGDNLLIGGEGNDTVLAGYGADTVRGGEGDDSLAGFGPFGGSPSGFDSVNRRDGADRIDGGRGNDGIHGGGGADTAFGGAGDDTLQGSYGADALQGGSGADVFFYARSVPGAVETGIGEGERDVIADFQRGTDLIDLRGYGNTVLPPAERDPLFLGTGAFVASLDLQVRYVVEEDRVILQFATVFGQPPPDVPIPVPTGPAGEIELVGLSALSAEDLLLI